MICEQQVSRPSRISAFSCGGGGVARIRVELDLYVGTGGQCYTGRIETMIIPLYDQEMKS